MDSDIIDSEVSVIVMQNVFVLIYFNLKTISSEEILVHKLHGLLYHLCKTFKAWTYRSLP